jgi:hypothetical protein
MEMEPRPMAMNSVSTPDTAPKSVTKRRRNPYISGFAVRILIALIVSWLVLMAFFVTAVASH